MQSGNEEVIAVNDHMVTMKRAGVVCDVIIHLVIDGVFNVSY